MNTEQYVILEIQHDGVHPLVWFVGYCLGGTAQTFSKLELERELKSYQESRPKSIFKPVLV